MATRITKRKPRHHYDCADCGVTASATALWQIRHRQWRCIACNRIANGNWQCGTCASTDPHHNSHHDEGRP